ncbi:TonB-dependent receptor [Flavisphingomonas formosensis]|uniref:TonB-dependent receptor n=1 Tax=Flavisphingomonas formosensis TaxID=861534 RepID=UPI0012F7085D|nr:TonB-dependent receptor [Sphingomonas formosensis]
MSNSDRDDARSVAPAFLALSCVGLLSSPALAQDAPTSDPQQGPRLGGATVTATAIDEEGYKAERVESPKAVAPLLDTPRSILVIDKQLIQDTGAATLADALRTVPGITFGAAEGGNPIGDRPFIRGFDTQGSTFLDGVRDIGAQTREVFAVEQVQVVRGSDSTLGGRGSAGGSINVISKLPQADTFARLDGSFGNADYKRITGDVNYRLSEQVAVRLAAMWHDQDVAERDAIWQKRWGVAPSITIGMGGPTRLTAAYYHLDTDELPDSGIPFLYTIANAPAGNTVTTPAMGEVTTAGGQTGRVKRTNFYGLKDRDFRDSHTDQFTLRAQHDFGGVTLRNTTRYSHTWQAYSFLLPDDSQGNVFGTASTNPTTGAAAARGDILTGGYVWRRANTRYGYTNSIVNQTDLYGTFETGSIKHSFAIGAEISWEKARRGAFVLATGSTISPRCNTATVARYYCTSLFDPNPNDPWVNYASDTSNVQVPISKNLPITETQQDANTKAVYAFDSITITDQLILNLGIRYDHFQSKVQPGLAATALPTARYTVRRSDGIVDYQAGLIFKPTKETSLYVSYATASTPPNSLIGEGREDNALGSVGTTIPNSAAAQAFSDALKVQRTKSFEAGAKANLFGDALALTGAVFQTETTNARVTSDANTVEFIGKTRIRGFEATASGNITDKWSVFGGYTYLDAKVRDGGYTSLAVAAITDPVTKEIIQPATSKAVVSVNTGKQLPQVAKHSFTMWTEYKVTPAFTLGGGAFYTSRIYGGYADNRSASQDAAGVITVKPATKTLARAVPGWWRFDARASYTINDHFQLAVNAQNLFNKLYYNQVYTSHYASIAPGRTVFGTLTVKY